MDQKKGSRTDGWSILETVSDFHRMVAEQGRPATEDVFAFVVDGHVPISFSTLNAAVVEKTGRELAELLEAMKKEYREVIGREPRRVERYWVAFGEIRKMATGREQFYAGKAVRREEWFLADFDLLFEDKLTWARLRVFDDGSADAWTATGVAGFDDEQSASTFIGEGQYEALDTLRKMPQYTPKVPHGPPAGRSDESQPFRYLANW